MENLPPQSGHVSNFWGRTGTVIEALRGIADWQARRGGTPLEALVESEGLRAESGFTLRSRPIPDYQAFLRKV